MILKPARGGYYSQLLFLVPLSITLDSTDLKAWIYFYIALELRTTLLKILLFDLIWRIRYHCFGRLGRSTVLLPQILFSQLVGPLFSASLQQLFVWSWSNFSPQMITVRIFEFDSVNYVGQANHSIIWFSLRNRVHHS